MSKANRVSSYLLAGVAILLLGSSSARADGVSVSLDGSLVVDSGVHVNVDAAVQALYDLDVGLDFGIRFAEPPPPPPAPEPPCSRSCAAAVPSYYVAQPIYPQPVRVTAVQPVAVASAPPRMNRWGLGAFAGSMDVDGQEAGADLGLLARYRLSRSFSLEAELARSKLADGTRVDRRLGASLHYDLAPGRTLSPFLLAGAGFGQTEIGGGEFHAEQGYGEVGAGLSYRISRDFHLVADARVGAREGSSDVAYRSTEPVSEFSEDEKYSRLRIGGLLFF